MELNLFWGKKKRFFAYLHNKLGSQALVDHQNYNFFGKTFVKCKESVMTSLGLLVWRHYVRQQPPTVVLAKAKADIAHTRTASFPVVVVVWIHGSSRNFHFLLKDFSIEIFLSWSVWGARKILYSRSTNCTLSRSIDIAPHIRFYLLYRIRIQECIKVESI